MAHFNLPKPKREGQNIKTYEDTGKRILETVTDTDSGMKQYKWLEKPRKTWVVNRKI